jgi:nucleoside 2-deoxyribosyltransferase
MKLYIAAQDQHAAREASQSLRIEGHVITARWLHAEFMSTEFYSEAERIQIAFDDVRDVVRADALVLLEPSPLEKVPGGKFVEVGVALGLNKRVYVVGPRANMLMWHPLVTCVANLSELCNELRD